MIECKHGTHEGGKREFDLTFLTRRISVLWDHNIELTAPKLVCPSKFLTPKDWLEKDFRYSLLNTQHGPVGWIWARPLSVTNLVWPWGDWCLSSYLSSYIKWRWRCLAVPWWSVRRNASFQEILKVQDARLLHLIKNRIKIYPIPRILSCLLCSQ